MRKLFVLLVAIAFFATPVFALVETANNGPQNVTSCWIKDAATIPYGGLVCLVTGNGVTFPGKQVTGSDSDLGHTQIYGVHIGDTVTAGSAQQSGVWIPVQTHGYVAHVILNGGNASDAATLRAGNIIHSSPQTCEGAISTVAYSAATTGNIATFGVPDSGGGTTSAWLYGI